MTQVMVLKKFIITLKLFSLIYFERKFPAKTPSGNIIEIYKKFILFCSISNINKNIKN